MDRVMTVLDIDGNKTMSYPEFTEFLLAASDRVVRVWTKGCPSKPYRSDTIITPMSILKPEDFSHIQNLGSFILRRPVDGSDPIVATALSLNGSKHAICLGDGRVVFRDLKHGLYLYELVFEAAASCCCLTADGHIFAMGGQNGEVEVSNVVWPGS